MNYWQIVATQPAELARSAAAVERAVGGLELDPWRQGTLGIVAMGAASFAAQAFGQRLARHGRRVVWVEASELVALGAGADLADAYIFVSEGGRSRETIEAATNVQPGRRLAVTNSPQAPLSDAVDAVLDLGHGEDSKVYTVGYTSMLQGFAQLARALDGVDEGDRINALPELVAAELVRAALIADEAARLLDDAVSVDVVASGSDRTTANEIALLLRESTRTSTTAFETYQYLHGPMESLSPERAVILVGEGREVTLAAYLAGQGVPTVLITSSDARPDGVLVVPTSDGPPLTRAILQIVPAQVIAGALARRRGLAIDGFRFHQDDTKVEQVPTP